MNTLIPWVLTFHIIGIVMWIGGLFMAMAAAAGAAGVEGDGRVQSARLANKGLRGFAHPGAALVIITGALLFYLLPELRMAPWLHAKLALVIILIVMDLLLSFRLRHLATQQPSSGKMGMFHGTISLLFLLIVILAVVRPF